MKTPRPARSGFTLIELLVVIAIIAILAGLILNVAGNIQQKTARSRAAAEIASMAAALESYKADYGDYPVFTNVKANTVPNTPAANLTLYQALTQTGTNGNGKVYFQFSQKMLTGTAPSYTIIDPFGTAYGYYYGNGTYNGVSTNGGVMNGAGFYDLWSTSGSTTNTNIWVNNW